jgi:hypothetical protein
MADRAKEIVEANGFSNGSIIDIFVLLCIYYSVCSLFVEGIIAKAANYNYYNVVVFYSYNSFERED